MSVFIFKCHMNIETQKMGKYMKLIHNKKKSQTAVQSLSCV